MTYRTASLFWFLLTCINFRGKSVVSQCICKQPDSV